MEVKTLSGAVFRHAIFSKKPLSSILFMTLESIKSLHFDVADFRILRVSAAVAEVRMASMET